MPPIIGGCAKLSDGSGSTFAKLAPIEQNLSFNRFARTTGMMASSGEGMTVDLVSKGQNSQRAFLRFLGFPRLPIISAV